MHFGGGHIGVPVGDRTNARPGMQVHTGQSERRRNQRAGSLAIGPESLPILVKLGIKAAGTPARQDLLDSSDVRAKEVR